MAAPRVAGIDLGTTNSALAWGAAGGPIHVFDVPQLTGPAEVSAIPTLPSFVYLPTAAERDGGLVALPWNPRPDRVAGVFAREHGALVSSRLVASAKSWLANPSVDRTAPLLPWGVETDRRLSPVEASAAVLRHLREAWDSVHPAPEERLERLPLVLTVPASFDEEARELTLRAAVDAGFGQVTLLEEPIAALYAWIAGHRRDLETTLPDGALVLVCDVGGGTSDLSLMRAAIEDGELRFERIAIGEHLLLGGDNLDLALAARLERQMTADSGTALSLAQRQILRRKASAAKEQLLGDPALRAVPVTVLGAGRGVVGGGVTAGLTRETVEEVLLEGFLPLVEAADVPARDRRAGLRELGLPYEPEPAITRHLAAFLARAGRDGGGGLAQPDAVLFNGGFFTPALARARVLDALEHWFGRRPIELESTRPEAAVAIGAAFYGRLRQHPDAARRLLIRAGSARAYYVGVQSEGEPRAICVLPRGTQEGSSAEIDREFIVTTNQPAAFTLYSATAGHDRTGDIVPVNRAGEPLHRHAPLVTVLRYGKRSRQVPLAVTVGATFTETGTLELWCASRSSEHRWRLAFNLRAVEAEPLDAEDRDEVEGAGGGDEAIIDPAATEAATAMLQAVFTGVPDAPAPDALPGELERVLGFGRPAWPLALIRKFADVLIATAAGRGLSPAHEVRWLNLTGFCLRPGFGTPLDTFRVSELRKVYAAGLVFSKEVQAQVEWLVLWQRVSGGFSTGQQRELAQRVGGQVGVGQRRPPRVNPQIEREAWRLLGSLERLDAGERTRLGRELIDRLKRDPRNRALLWSLGRCGARVPLYGPLSSVVPAAEAASWIDRLLDKPATPDAIDAIVQMAARTGDPARDLPDDARQRIEERLTALGAERDQLRPLREAVARDIAGAARVFGESLPEGLTIADG
jgi:molecular chaperone DnaK (HSP70)